MERNYNDMETPDLDDLGLDGIWDSVTGAASGAWDWVTGGGAAAAGSAVGQQAGYSPMPNEYPAQPSIQYSAPIGPTTTGAPLPSSTIKPIPTPTQESANAAAAVLAAGGTRDAAAAAAAAALAAQGYSSGGGGGGAGAVTALAPAGGLLDSLLKNPLVLGLAAFALMKYLKNG